MTVSWVSQENPTSAEDALEKSIAKWRFFSYCTKEQLSQRLLKLTSNCGLCNWDVASGNEEGCPKCPFRHPEGGCPDILWDASKATHAATLAQFHAAARKVFKKLRSLRK